jgi:hypothetical protein
VILWIMLLSVLFRAVNYVTGPDDWGWRHAYWNPYFGMAGLLAAIVIISGALWFTRCIYPRDRD